jgi:hypothetical protein
VSLTNGSGSRRPKNIRIRNTESYLLLLIHGVRVSCLLRGLLDLRLLLPVDALQLLNLSLRLLLAFQLLPGLLLDQGPAQED